MYESALGTSALPVDAALSMGVHESQSLFWERHVGLSRAFWTYVGSKVRECLHVSGTDDELYSATNRVTPSLIRVEADELTYRAARGAGERTACARAQLFALARQALRRHCSALLHRARARAQRCM